MKVSTRGDYASRALLSLALHTGQAMPTSVRDIAERTGLPQPYLEQILLALKGAGLVRSKRGVGGGYVLARSAEAITVGQIVSAVEGPIVAGDFGEPHQNGACDHEGQCVLLSLWAEVGEHMRRHLDSFTLADMVSQASGSPTTTPPVADSQAVDLLAAGLPATGSQAAAAATNGSSTTGSDALDGDPSRVTVAAVPVSPVG